MPFDHVIRTPDELYEPYSQPGDGVRDQGGRDVRRALPRIHRALAVRPRRHGRRRRALRRLAARRRRRASSTVLDDTRLVIPDASGNNRLDTLRNITQTGQIGLLFLIPGMAETLRVNGRACITTDPELLARARRRAGQAAEGRDRHRPRSRRSCTAPRPSCARTCGSRPPGPIARASRGPAQIWKDHIGMPEPLDEVEDWLANDYATNM